MGAAGRSARVPGLELAGRFGWMETEDHIHGGTGDWLDDTKGVGDLLEAAFDYWNEAALRTYRRLGFTLRPLGAAVRTR